jgi:hypothetical protein
VKYGNIVNAYDDYIDLYTFEIVAADREGYYIFVPHYIYLNGGLTATAHRCRELNIDPAFIGENISYILDCYACRVVSEIDGIKCSRCKDFFGMAAPNQDDGTFLCKACIQNPYR